MKKLLLFGILIIFLVACTPVKENPTIEEIVKNPRVYNGKVVTVNGTYYGWTYPDLECKNEPVSISKSDTMFADNGYCMHLTGGEIIYPEEPLTWPPTEQKEQFMIIKAKIEIREGKPFFSDIE